QRGGGARGDEGGGHRHQDRPHRAPRRPRVAGGRFGYYSTRMGAKTASTGLIIPVLETPTSVAQRLAERVRALRLERGWSRGELAERAGISEETVKSFERRAQITLSRLLLIARALEALDDFLPLFAPRPAGTLSEIETRQRPRVRGRRRKS